MKSLVYFPMKTTAKTIFSLMAAGFVLTTINARSSAQTSSDKPTPEKPLSPQIMKILCERSPLNSRCAGGSGSAGSSSMPATPPMGGGSSDGSTSMPTTPPAGGTTIPPGEATPPAPAPTIKEPAGGSTLPPGTPGGTKSEPTPVVPAPLESPAPAKPYHSGADKLSNPVGPSSALPSVPSKISAEPTSTPKSSGSAAELVDPAKAKAPAAKTPSSATEPSAEKPSADVPSSTSPDGVSKPSATDTAPSTPAEATTPAGSTSPATPTSSGTVVEVVGGNAKLSTLSAALKAAGLDKKLAGKGPFTIFAPSDEAFAALPPEALQDLLKPENKAKLAQLLTYHVISGKAESKTLKSGETTTVQGKPLTVKVEDSKVMVNDATVTQADVGASNGVIHIIDKVILPSAG
jgi:uncharacterized surface protein with fasciclin (FAS1) repeats